MGVCGGDNIPAGQLVDGIKTRRVKVDSQKFKMFINCQPKLLIWGHTNINCLFPFD